MAWQRFYDWFPAAMVDKARERTRVKFVPMRKGAYTRAIIPGWPVVHLPCEAIGFAWTHEYAHAFVLVNWPWRSLIASRFAHEAAACTMVRAIHADELARGKLGYEYARAWRMHPNPDYSRAWDAARWLVPTDIEDFLRVA
jgi:hypothetical protein